MLQTFCYYFEDMKDVHGTKISVKIQQNTIDFQSGTPICAKLVRAKSSRTARAEFMSYVLKVWLVPRTNRVDIQNLHEACEQSGTESQGTDNKFWVVSHEHMEENW
jgi:hypothetical protein